MFAVEVAVRSVVGTRRLCTRPQGAQGEDGGGVEGCRHGQGYAMAAEATASVDVVAQDDCWGMFHWSWPGGQISNKQQQLIMTNDEYYLLIIFDNY